MSSLLAHFSKQKPIQYAKTFVLAGALILASCPVLPSYAVAEGLIDDESSIIDDSGAIVDNDGDLADGVETKATVALNLGDDTLFNSDTFADITNLAGDLDLGVAAVVNNKYNPADHTAVPVSSENSSEHWENADYRTKITTINNTNQSLPINLADENGNALSATIYRMDNGQAYVYHIIIDGETDPVVVIDYTGNKGNMIDVEVMRNIEFALRWQINQGEYQYYNFNSGIGSYEIPKQKGNTDTEDIVVNDMWVGFGQPTPPPTPREFMCYALNPIKSVIKFGNTVSYTIETTADNEEDVFITYMMDGQFIGKTFDYTYNDAYDFLNRAVNNKVQVAINVSVSFSGENVAEGWSDCDAEIEISQEPKLDIPSTGFNMVKPSNVAAATSTDTSALAQALITMTVMVALAGATIVAFLSARKFGTGSIWK